MKAIARFFGVHYSTVSRAVQQWEKKQLGCVNVAMQDPMTPDTHCLAPGFKSLEFILSQKYVGSSK